MRTIYLITNQSADKISYWSGIPFYTKKKLESQYRVVQINPGEFWVPSMINRTFNVLKRRLNLRYNFQHSLLSGLIYAPIVWYLLRVKYKSQSGLILGEAISSEILFIPKRYKVVLFADATFSLLMKGYSSYRNLMAFSKWESQWIDRLSLRRANQLMFTSEWARNQAILEAGIQKSTTSIVRFGANLEDLFTNEDVQSRLKDATMRFLFPSTDWDRKGGNRALEFLNRLAIRNHRQVELVIFGPMPSNIKKNEKVIITSLGWLNKSKPDEMSIMIEAFKKSDFLLLLTKADCTPVAISEAFCYGLPVISSDVGGISEMLNDTDIGILWNQEKEQETMKWIEERVKRKAYIKASEAARLAYENAYNWDIWLNNFNQVVNSL